MSKPEINAEVVSCDEHYDAYPRVVLHSGEDVEWLKGCVDRMPMGGTFVEVGVAFGGLAMLLWPHVQRRYGLYYAVDHFDGTDNSKPEPKSLMTRMAWNGRRVNKAVFLKNLSDAGIDADIRLIEVGSVYAAQVFDFETLDIVYLDADHSYEAVRDDIDAWWPKIVSDGWLMGHDYIDPQEGNGVMDAVQRHCRLNHALTVERGGERCWRVRKP